MTLAVDSSVAIAAILADHEAHARAEQALAESAATIAHVAVETYSVLTRMPPPHRLDAPAAATIVGARLPVERVALNASSYGPSLDTLSAARISGGATYDGMIALTALAHELRLISNDPRAARTYRALGVDFRLLTT